MAHRAKLQDSQPVAAAKRKRAILPHYKTTPLASNIGGLVYPFLDIGKQNYEELVNAAEQIMILQTPVQLRI